jgi:hypothetical protein
MTTDEVKMILRSCKDRIFPEVVENLQLFHMSTNICLNSDRYTYVLKEVANQLRLTSAKVEEWAGA